MRKRQGCWTLALLVLAVWSGPAAQDEPARESAPQPGGGERVWLGVLLDAAVDGGVRIVAVVPGGPADRAGLEAGDLVLALDEEAALRPEALASRVSGKSPGERVRLEVIRAGERLSREVRVARRPPGREAVRSRLLELELPSAAATAGPPSAPDAIGGFLEVELADVSPELRVHYGAPREAGLLVTRVAAGEAGGLRVGDVVTGLCGQPLRARDQANPCRSLDPRPARVRVELVRDRSPHVLDVDAAEGYARSVAPVGTGLAELAWRLAAAERPEALRVRLIREEIRRLEQRLAELKRELERSQ